MNLEFLIKEAGGPYKVSKWLQISPRAIYRWIEKDALPHTEYSGHTSYSKKIEEHTYGAVSAETLLQVGRPNKI